MVEEWGLRLDQSIWPLVCHNNRGLTVMSLRIIIMNAVAVFTWTCLFSVTTMAQTSGPERGSLVIVGGGMQDLGILVRFGELAGGLDAPIVVIPTAGGADN